MILLLSSSINSYKFFVHPFGIEFAAEISAANLLIALAFVIVTIAANLNFTGGSFERLLCNLYAFISLICLFAVDYISMFVAIELMMLLASAIIFTSKPPAAGRYFITHIIGGSLLMLGACFVAGETSSTTILPLTATASTDLQFAYFLLLAGYLIMMAAAGSSGWMVECYPAASSSAFPFLITFTTKIAAILTLKLFSGLYILKIAGGLTMLYGAAHALTGHRDRIKSLCYIIIAQLGFIMTAIGAGALYIDLIEYIFIHILYTALLAISLSANGQGLLAGLCLIFSLVMAANFPLSSGYLLKSSITSVFDGASLAISYLSNILIVATLFNLRRAGGAEHPSRAGLLVLLVPAVLANLWLAMEIPVSLTVSIKQLAVIVAGITLGSLMRKNYYFPAVDIFAPIGSHFNSNYLQKDEHREHEMGHEDFGLKHLIYFPYSPQVMSNQQAAIFVVFSIFILVVLL